MLLELKPEQAKLLSEALNKIRDTFDHELLTRLLANLPDTAAGGVRTAEHRRTL